MKLITKYHGTIQYGEDEVIYFKKGLPGFPGLTKFILFSVKENELFNILHSIEDDSVGLVVISPFCICKDYEVELKENILDELSIADEKDVLIVNTVSLNSDVKKITSNFKAPIIINIKSKLGEQIILSDEKYEIKYPIFKE